MKRNYIILLLLFEFALGIKFNLFGTMSVGELFLLIYAPIILLKKSLFRQYPILKKISLLYLGLLVSQMCSELIIGNIFSNSLKGFASTVISYLHFIFLFSLFIKDRKYIAYAYAGIIIKLLIIGNTGTEVRESSTEEILSGQGAEYLKFYLIQILKNPLLILSIFIFNQKTWAKIFCIVGLLFIILGARSAGLITFLSGILVYLLLFGRKIVPKKIILIFILAGIIGYGFYIVYVNQVLSGKITSGNSEQILLLNNPYNPINLLFAGRTEALIGWQAFMDEFFLGHGAWAIDITGKYHSLFGTFRNDTANIIVSGGQGIIPAHSVLIGAGMQNGISAFLFMFAILLFFLKKGFGAINSKDKYLNIIVSCLMGTFWTGLFSASSTFKNTLPLSFAIILASYIINKNYQKKQV